MSIDNELSIGKSKSGFDGVGRGDIIRCPGKKEWENGLKHRSIHRNRQVFNDVVLGMINYKNVCSMKLVPRFLMLDDFLDMKR